MKYVCISCNRSYAYLRNKGHTKQRCNSCLVNDRRIALRRKVVDYLGGSCKYCGYSKCFGALHAHHIDSATKEFSISGSHCRSWKSIKLELDKCILICSNCHSELHHDCDRYGCL